RGDRGGRLRAEGDGHAQRGQDVGEVVFLRAGSGLHVVEVDTGTQLGADVDAAIVELQADAEVGGQVGVFMLVRIAAVRHGRIQAAVFLFMTLPAQAHAHVRPPGGVRVAEVVARIGAHAVLAPPHARLVFVRRIL